MRTSAAAVVLTLVTALTGCGGKDEAPTGETAMSAEPVWTPPESAEPIESANPTEPATDTCQDAAGDGGPIDLQKVSLTVGDEVTLTLQLGNSLPQTGTAMVGVLVASADGAKSRQLAVKWVDGQATGPFVFDFGTTNQENLSGSDMAVNGTTVTLTLPARVVADLGQGWKWSAFANAAGNDTDACPGAPGGMDKQPFPAP